MDTNLQVAALKCVLTFTSSFILSKPLEGCSLFMEISEVKKKIMADNDE